MSTTSLGKPGLNLFTENFPVTPIEPAGLYRISSYDNGEPFFGASGGNRFDAPGSISGKPEYKTCYLGQSLAVAVAESLLHDEVAVNGRFPIAPETIRALYVHRFAGDRLDMLSLTGPLLKRCGSSAELSGTGNYALTQQWSMAVYMNPASFDGFIYLSRHVTTSLAFVLFDRCRKKICPASHTPLVNIPGFAQVVQDFGIVGS